MFSRLVFITLLLVYFLVFVGAFVRSVGAGMGCPDWPKCFDRWVPPTSAEQLPDNYQEILRTKRVAKSVRFAKVLSALGMKEKARLIEEYSTHEAEGVELFNSTKTWVEYINRLVGVLVGFFIFFCLVASFKFRKTQPKVFWLSLFTFVLVGFQGWLGSLVVATNLFPGLISFHMFIAMLIGMLLIYLYFISKGYHRDTNVVSSSQKRLRLLLLVSVFLLLVQVIMGTNVREQIDIIAKSFDYQHREGWIEQLNALFFTHRSFSIVILLLQLLILWLLKKNIYQPFAYFLMLGFILLEVGIGAVMAYFAIPAALQPVHLLIGVGLVGVQYWFFLLSGCKFAGDFKKG